VDKVIKKLESQFHFGSIQTLSMLIHRGVWVGEVSIPLWFNSNAKLVNANEKCIVLSQFHFGSIQTANKIDPQTSGEGLNSTLVQFKLITDGNNVTVSRQCLNSTLVQFKQFSSLIIITFGYLSQFNFGSIQTVRRHLFATNY